MGKKGIFLDIDGTLVGFDRKMPDSAKAALSLARKNGHKVFICTGRTRGMIYPWLIDIGFDGIVASAGAYVEAEGNEVFHQILEERAVEAALDILDCHGASYMLQSKEYCYVTHGFHERMDARDDVPVVTRKTDEDRQGRIELAKGETVKENLESITYFGSDITIEQTKRLLDAQREGYFELTGSSFGKDHIFSGELTRKGITKGTGMEHMLRYFGIKQKDSVGIGDGMNDFDMLQYAATAIAMGNAVEELKEIADYVTSSVSEDGIQKAFQKFGII